MFTTQFAHKGEMLNIFVVSDTELKRTSITVNQLGHQESRHQAITCKILAIGPVEIN